MCKIRVWEPTLIGESGAEYDLIIDYIDEDEDGKADIQIIVDNGRKDFHGKWTSHFLVFRVESQSTQSARTIISAIKAAKL